MFYCSVSVALNGIPQHYRCSCLLGLAFYSVFSLSLSLVLIHRPIVDFSVIVERNLIELELFSLFSRLV